MNTLPKEAFKYNWSSELLDVLSIEHDYEDLCCVDLYIGTPGRNQGI